MELDSAVPMALIDKVRDHTETRKRLHDPFVRFNAPGRSPSPRRGRAGRQTSWSDTVEDLDDEIETENNGLFVRHGGSEDSLLLGRPLHQYPPGLRHAPSPPRDRPQCSWPGCYNGFRRQRGEMMREVDFWAPLTVTQALQAEESQGGSAGLHR